MEFLVGIALEIQFYGVRQAYRAYSTPVIKDYLFSFFKRICYKMALNFALRLIKPIVRNCVGNEMKIFLN